ncbi:repressor of RNA polymerase III transcription MAF1 homolog [Galendromus occidentalis]|uniref:Repressor of RNA polymerase III transcription MAF1 n=1 Tax=Galendromus occidentalis TaxID=34638 RepID=A0AAJ6QV41_9ACAR|nr:repressor of RNA polymerase III transcription MAF1 homolog [Galendromus occidentalis]
MKLLERAKFEALNSELELECGDCRILGRVESYSCKSTQQEKRLFRTLNADVGVGPNALEALSPPEGHDVVAFSPSSAGSEDSPLCDTISRKVLFHLIATLNASFAPDYDFSQARSEEFSKEPSLEWVMNAVDSQLAASACNVYQSRLRNHLWGTIDEEICLNDCVIYSYRPDFCSDPYGEEGTLWSFNYFFYNRHLKRLVFFTCHAASRSPNTSFVSNDEDSMGMEFGVDDLVDCVQSSSQAVAY